jgi:hypothetical protein
MRAYLQWSLLLLHWYGCTGWVLHGDDIVQMTTRHRRDVTAFTRLLVYRNHSTSHSISDVCANIQMISPNSICLYKYTYMERILLKVPTEYVDTVGVQSITEGSLLYGYIIGVDIHVHLLQPATTTKQQQQQQYTKKASFSYEGIPWHLDVLDRTQGQPRLDFVYSVDAPGAGNATDIYVLDTGIDCAHGAFRAQRCYTLAHFDSDQDIFSTDCLTTGCGMDNHGHGTQCGSLVNGVYTGVAKNSSIYAIKVLDSEGTGYMADVFMALDYLLTYMDTLSTTRRSVVSMSIGCSCIDTTPCSECAQRCSDYIWAEHMTLLAEYSRRQIPIVIAAGNTGCNICAYSLHTAPYTYIVGASTTTNERASFSNYGDCVDNFAPGVDIVTAYYNTNNKYVLTQGTSMSTPIVAGIIALFNPANTYTVSDIRMLLANTTVENIVSAKYSIETTYVNQTPAIVQDDDTIPTPETTTVNNTVLIIIIVVSSVTTILLTGLCIYYCKKQPIINKSYTYTAVPVTQY